METTNFEQQVAAMQNAQEHAQEIRNTRVGGLGGSDASILLKIGTAGMSALTTTDNKRLAIMCGISEQTDWGGNAYTNAGHLFEDYAEKNLPFGPEMVREELIEQKLALNFRIFAHADFTTSLPEYKKIVVECKFVQATTAQVVNKYNAQLQWYYMLGVDKVFLYHGTGSADPFEVHTGELFEIERDEAIISALLAGIKILDDALTNGWKPENVEKININDTPDQIQEAFIRWMEIKEKKAALEIEEKETSAKVKEYMEDFGFSGIVAKGDVKHQVIYTRGGTKFAFDSAKFLQDHPEFDLPEYYKKTTTKSSVTFK